MLNRDCSKFFSILVSRLFRTRFTFSIIDIQIHRDNSKKQRTSDESKVKNFHLSLLLLLLISFFNILYTRTHDNDGIRI